MTEGADSNHLTVQGQHTSKFSRCSCRSRARHHGAATRSSSCRALSLIRLDEARRVHRATIKLRLAEKVSHQQKEKRPWGGTPW